MKEREPGSIKHFKRQAKKLLRAWRAGDSGALARVTKIYDEPVQSSLMRAQHVVVQEYGFRGWGHMKTRDEDVRQRMIRRREATE